MIPFSGALVTFTVTILNMEYSVDLANTSSALYKQTLNDTLFLVSIYNYNISDWSTIAKPLLKSNQRLVTQYILLGHDRSYHQVMRVFIWFSFLDYKSPSQYLKRTQPISHFKQASIIILVLLTRKRNIKVVYITSVGGMEGKQTDKKIVLVVFGAVFLKGQFQ